jgi:hypothetical protein
VGEYPQIDLFCYSISLQKTERDTAEQWVFLRSKVLFSSCEIQHQNKSLLYVSATGFFFLAVRFHFDADGVHVPSFRSEVGTQGGHGLTELSGDGAVRH